MFLKYPAQLTRCYNNRKYSNSLFQKFLIDPGSVFASRINACSMGGQGKNQNRKYLTNLALGQIACHRRNPDKNRIKKRHSHRCTDRNTQYHQNRHYQYRSSCTGHGTDSSSHCSQKQNRRKILLNGKSSCFFLCVLFIFPEKDGNPGKKHYKVKKDLYLILRNVYKFI